MLSIRRCNRLIRRCRRFVVIGFHLEIVLPPSSPDRSGYQRSTAFVAFVVIGCHPETVRLRRLLVLALDVIYDGEVTQGLSHVGMVAAKLCLSDLERAKADAETQRVH